MTKVFFTHRAEKDVRKLDKMLKQRVRGALLILSEEPLKGEALVGQFKGLRRYRVGDFRIVYEFNQENNTILVIKIGHRKEVYH